MAGDENHKTYRGFSAPDSVHSPSASTSERAPDEQRRRAPVIPQAPRSPTAALREQLKNAPMVEIEVVHEVGPAPRTERPWRTLEIWTRNRIYITDPFMICIDVVDRATREHRPTHPFIGTQLVGGQHRDGERIELSYPFPRPGTEAVFESRTGAKGNFSRTSTVVRVILRLHCVTVSPNKVVPTWAEITGH